MAGQIMFMQFSELKVLPGIMEEDRMMMLLGFLEPVLRLYVNVLGILQVWQHQLRR
jgi:hypothetical protein